MVNIVTTFIWPEDLYPQWYIIGNFTFHSNFFHYRQDFSNSNHKVLSNLFPRNANEFDECTEAQNIAVRKEANVKDLGFDANEMPSNAINTNNSDKPSRIAGLVLSRRTGFVVAHQRGTLMDIEIT